VSGESPERLAAAARVLIHEVAKLRPGQQVLIYVDSLGDRRVAASVFDAALELGARPQMILYPAPSGVGAQADPEIPASLVEAMLDADVIIEFSAQYLLYSRSWEYVMGKGRAKFLCLAGIDQEMFTRLIGGVDIPKLEDFERRLAKITGSARAFRVTSEAGTDISFQNDPDRPIFVEGVVGDKPGEYMLIGQVDWAPIEETIEGTIVFDGSVWPPKELGRLSEPVILRVSRGRVVDVEGGREAAIFRAWLEGFRSQAMLNLAHISYGCHPRARLTGRVIEDERVWGCVQWGLGHQAESFRGRAGPAPSHTDGICLRASVEADGVPILASGSYVHPELVGLERQLLGSEF
jgi:2,5-dihydroxypyridine 5,6-dioxygenase